MRWKELMNERCSQPVRAQSRLQVRRQEEALSVLPSAPSQPGGSGDTATSASLLTFTSTSSEVQKTGSVTWCKKQRDWPTSLTPRPQSPGPQFQAFPGQVSAGFPRPSHLFSPAVGEGGPENSEEGTLSHHLPITSYTSLGVS